MDLESRSNIKIMHHQKSLFIGSGIIVIGFVLFLLGRHLIKEYDTLTYTVNSSHLEIQKMNLSLRKFDNGPQIINAVWDPEVNVFQVCLRDPSERDIEGFAWLDKLSFYVDGQLWEDIAFRGTRIWLGDYTMIWLENVTDFETVTVVNEKTGQELKITH